MEQKLKIAMIITNYGFGGAQKAFADHSRILREYGEVREYVFNDFEEKRLYDTGNPYYSLNVPGGGGVIGNLKNLQARIRAFKKYKDEYKPDITISFMEGADYVSMLSGGTDRKIIVIQGSKVGDQNISGVKGRLRHKVLMPWLYKKADKIIGVSEDIRREMTGFYKIPAQKVAVAHNFYDEDNLAQRLSADLPDELTSLFKTDDFKLITFARLAVQKNLGSLFPVFDQLKKDGQKVKLYILGDGELREELLSQAREVGTVWSIWGIPDSESRIPDLSIPQSEIRIPNSELPIPDSPSPIPNSTDPKSEIRNPESQFDIFFLGFQPNPMAYLKYADLFLMPSLWEGSPLALCEAMASDIAVCSTDCPTGPREIIDEEVGGSSFGILKNGGIMPMIATNDDVDNVKFWADSITKLIGDRPLLKTLAANGKKRVKNFSKSVLGPIWAKEYIS